MQLSLVPLLPGSAPLLRSPPDKSLFWVSHSASPCGPASQPSSLPVSLPQREKLVVGERLSIYSHLVWLLGEGNVSSLQLCAAETLPVQWGQAGGSLQPSAVCCGTALGLLCLRAATSSPGHSWVWTPCPQPLFPAPGRSRAGPERRSDSSWASAHAEVRGAGCRFVRAAHRLSHGVKSQ